MKKCCISIDMDFFCREEPKWDWGHNENTALMNSTIWTIRFGFMDIYKETDPEKYADCLPVRFYALLKDKGFKFDKHTLLGLSWTHKDAYDFFSKMKSKTIFNFDAHHDCGYPWIGRHEYIGKKIINSEMSCGNWGQHLVYKHKKKIKVVYPKWRTIEDDTMHCLKVERMKFESLPKEDYKIEAIFIAQSPAWVPPQFDSMMLDMITGFRFLCLKHDIEGGTIVKRECPTLKEAKIMYRQQKKEMKKLMQSQRRK